MRAVIANLWSVLCAALDLWGAMGLKAYLQPAALAGIGYLIQYRHHGSVFGDILPALAPPVGALGCTLCYCIIAGARALRHEEVENWKSYKPRIEGFRPREPAMAPLVAATTVLVTFAASWLVLVIAVGGYYWQPMATENAPTLTTRESQALSATLRSKLLKRPITSLGCTASSEPDCVLAGHVLDHLLRAGWPIRDRQVSRGYTGKPEAGILIFSGVRGRGNPSRVDSGVPVPHQPWADLLIEGFEEAGFGAKLRVDLTLPEDEARIVFGLNSTQRISRADIEERRLYRREVNRRQSVIRKILEEYRRDTNSTIDQPIDLEWVNRRLLSLGEKWRAEVAGHNFLSFPSPDKSRGPEGAPN